jgi:glutamate carboxypeptidase
VSDANHIWDSVPTIDGLGPSGDQAHCSERGKGSLNGQEYVERDSFVPKAALNVAGLLKLLEN